MEESKQEDAKRIVQNHLILKRAQQEDPLFLRRVFVAHYCNIPFHLLMDHTLYPRTLIEELFAASMYWCRNCELAPYQQDNFDDKLIDDLENGRLQYCFESGR